MVLGCEEEYMSREELLRSFDDLGHTSVSMTDPGVDGYYFCGQCSGWEDFPEEDRPFCGSMFTKEAVGHVIYMDKKGKQDLIGLC